MARTARSSTPAPLRAAERAFARWRAEGRRGRRIPAALWATAVVAARACGVSRTAVALGLHHGRLSEQLDGPVTGADRPRRASRRLRPPRTKAPAPAPFVELPPPSMPVPAPPPACRIEIHDRRGRRVCVELAAPALAQLPAVLRALGVARR